MRLPLTVLVRELMDAPRGNTDEIASVPHAQVHPLEERSDRLGGGLLGLLALGR
jgi:hypothetical protein